MQYIYTRAGLLYAAINIREGGPALNVNYITFYLADAFIQSDVQSSAIQGHTTTEHQIRYISHRLG